MSQLHLSEKPRLKIGYYLCIENRNSLRYLAKGFERSCLKYEELTAELDDDTQFHMKEFQGWDVFNKEIWTNLSFREKILDYLGSYYN
jgi:hypothetical protein